MKKKLPEYVAGHALLQGTRFRMLGFYHPNFHDIPFKHRNYL